MSHLREARLAAGLSQTDLAARLGRPQNYVSKCELGGGRMPPGRRPAVSTCWNYERTRGSVAKLGLESGKVAV